MTHYSDQFAQAMGNCGDVAQQVIEETRTLDASNPLSAIEETWCNPCMEPSEKLSTIFSILNQQIENDIALTQTQGNFVHSYNRYQDALKQMIFQNS